MDENSPFRVVESDINIKDFEILSPNPTSQRRTLTVHGLVEMNNLDIVYKFMSENIKMLRRLNSDKDNPINKDIAIIILNYNSEVDTIKCVKSLQEQRYDSFEIIIVDNCSKKPSLNVIRNFCYNESIHLIENNKNNGYNAGNNIGLKYAFNKGYKYALIANPDMEFPDKDMLQILVDRMSNDIVVVAPDIRGIDNSHQNPYKRLGDWKHSFYWIGNVIRSIIDSNAKDSLFDDWSKSHYCAMVSGCCFLIDLKFADAIGYFDEGVFLYCEESILSRQVEQLKYKMWYCANTYAVHAHIEKAKGNPNPRIRIWYRSKKYFIRNYSGNSWIGRQIAYFSAWLNCMVQLMIHSVK